MNYIDIAVLIFLLVHFFIGIYNGFLKSFLDLFKYIVAIIICKNTYIAFSEFLNGFKFVRGFVDAIVKNSFEKTDYLSNLIDNPNQFLINVFSIITIFVLIILISAILIELLDIILKLSGLSLWNRAIGGLFGIVKGIVFIMILFVIINPLVAFFGNEDFIKLLNESQLVKYIYMYNFLFDYFKELFIDFGNMIMTNI
ncbi:MAG: CvpA family protein [Peptostreptococcaceae bacterium]|jgi:membrane protein required for colicin V production|nr:CvpA family protein [Peptostreptococcaceae bacterium]